MKKELPLLPPKKLLTCKTDEEMNQHKGKIILKSMERICILGTNYNSKSERLLDTWVKMIEEAIANAKFTK